MDGCLEKSSVPVSANPSPFRELHEHEKGEGKSLDSRLHPDIGF